MKKCFVSFILIFLFIEITSLTGTLALSLDITIDYALDHSMVVSEDGLPCQPTKHWIKSV